MVTFFYEIEFVSGYLKGLKVEQELTYPESSYVREKIRFTKQIAEETIIKGVGGSSYKILSHRVKFS